MDKQIFLTTVVILLTKFNLNFKIIAEREIHQGNKQLQLFALTITKCLIFTDQPYNFDFPNSIFHFSS